MNKLLVWMVAAAGWGATITSCTFSDNTAVAEHKEYSLFTDSTQCVSPLIDFRFSINGNDNEMPQETAHRFLCIPHYQKAQTPVISFGELYMDTMRVPSSLTLPQNTFLTFRVDMRKVQNAFRQKGYYITPTGERINKDEFERVFVMGGTPALSWDANVGYMELKDEDGDGIYEGVVRLNGR